MQHEGVVAGSSLVVTEGVPVDLDARPCPSVPAAAGFSLSMGSSSCRASWRLASYDGADWPDRSPPHRGSAKVHSPVTAVMQTGPMAFGQQSGPPATHRQVKDLMDLLNNAGHLDFRDARGPMGFTQRQAGGKFTADEAQAFIDQLQEAEYASETGEAPPAPQPAQKLTKTEAALRKLPAETLAAELQRRGWIVAEP